MGFRGVGGAPSVWVKRACDLHDVVDSSVSESGERVEHERRYSRLKILFLEMPDAHSAEGFLEFL